MLTETPAIAEKVPPLIRVARLIVTDRGAMHVDNFTGKLVHEKKVDRALIKMGLSPYYEGDEDRDDPIVIKRRKGGPKINPVLLDATTASMLVRVWDALSPANRGKMPAMIERWQVIGLITRLWKIVK